MTSRADRSPGQAVEGGLLAAIEQAQALCDLVQDPQAGVTRVTMVHPSSALASALMIEAARRGLVADRTAHRVWVGRAATVGTDGADQGAGGPVNP